MSGRWRPKLRFFAVLAACGALFGQQIHLKSRDVETSAGPGFSARARRPGRLPVIGESGPEHQIIQFDHQPGVDDLSALVAAGYTITGSVPDFGVVVLLPGGSAAYAKVPGIRWQGSLESQDKISPVLTSQSPANTLVLVEFHADVNPVSQDAVAQAENLTLVRPAFFLPNHALVNASIEQIRELANHDEVAYIFPGDAELLNSGQVIPCAGMLTLAGPVGQYANLVHGWDFGSDHFAHLGYFFSALTPKVPATTVQSEILHAMNAWASVANVTFTASTSDKALRTIALKFASKSHGDAYAFDGAGGIVAHTFYPVPVNAESIAGDIHLDADENWHAGSDLDIYSVVLHEMGHALGLGHTDNPGDVMYPYYRRGLHLSANDIGALQSLYGAPANSTAPPAAITAAPIKLNINPVTPPGQGAEISVSGTLSGGIAPYSLQFQTDQAASGTVALGNTGGWSVDGVPLAVGTNTITVSAYDAAKATASQSATVTRLAKAPVAASPVLIKITTPAAAVSTAKSATISLTGTASGGAGVTTVTWQTSTGAAGTATGTDHWIAASVPLLTGTNTIILRAYDSAGATAWATAVVVRQ